MKKILYTLTLILAGSFSLINAQDFHLSQYNEASLYLNPALTGVLPDKMDYRGFADFRSQWRVISTNPYSSFSGGYDQRINTKYSVGGFLINNRSGVAGLNTFSLFGSGGYAIMDPWSDHQLHVGLQLGLLYRSFDPNQLTFESQYSITEGGIDPSISSGEYFEKTSLLKPNANVGVYYEYKDPDLSFKPFAGIAIYNALLPKISFNEDGERLPLKLNAHLGTDYNINEEWDIRPMILIMSQKKAFELNIGMQGFYKFNESHYTLVPEFYYRHKDAIILGIGVKQDNSMFKISYDINTSYLNNYSGGRGAIEFALVIYGIKGESPIKFKAKY